MMSTKEKIFYTALKLFSARSYDSVSIRDIVKEVGIKESSFYKHYESKNELLEDIFSFFESLLIVKTMSDNELTQYVKKTKVDSILNSLKDQYINNNQKTEVQQAWQIVTSEQHKNVKAGELVLKITDFYLSRLEKVFSCLIKSGKTRANDPRILAAIFGNTLRSMQMEYTLRKSVSGDIEVIKLDIENVVTEFAKMIKHENSEL